MKTGFVKGCTVFKGSDVSSFPKSVLLEQEGENRMRQIKKNEREAHTFPAESLWGGREKCRHLDIPFHGGDAEGYRKGDVENEDLGLFFFFF